MLDMISLSSLKSHNGHNMWDVLQSLGYTDIANHLGSPDSVHSLENVMMMAPKLRSHFDTLNLWSEPVEVRLGLGSIVL